MSQVAVSLVLVALPLVAALLVFSRLSEKRLSRRFEASLESDLYAALSGELGGLGCTEAAARAFIASLVAPGASAPMAPQAAASVLPALLRVEYELKKTDGKEVRRAVGVQFKRNGELAVRRAERGIPWESLPAQIRHEFIEKSTDTLAYVLYSLDAPGGADGHSR